MDQADASLLEELEKRAAAFLIPLKDKEGFNEAAFQELCETLRHCAHYWADRKVLPKLAVNVFVEMNPWLVGCEALYATDIRQRMVDAEMELTDLMLSCAKVS